LAVVVVIAKAAPKFDRARCASELRDALNGDQERWFSMVGAEMIAAGRNDGSATVLAAERGWTPAEVPEESDGAGECRWQVLQLPGDELTIDTYSSAAEAVSAANALSDPVVA